VSLLLALKCRGASDTWTGVPVSLSPPPILDGGAEFELAGVVVQRAPRLSSRAISPATPPPRIAQA
jgi:hypothetical protein